MTNNLPPDFSATVRRGATFGPVVFTVSGLDLTLYNLAAGVGTDDVAPTLTKTSGTTFSVTLPSALTSGLKFKALGSPASGHNPWWVDAVSIADPTVVVPLVGGVITVVQRGAHD